MKGPLAYGAAAFCLLLPLSSLSVSAAAAEFGQNSVGTKAVAGTANEGRGTTGVPAADRQAGDSVREDKVTEGQGTERRPTALWRSSSGLFKRSGTVSKLLTVSGIAAAVVMLGRVLSSCLAEIGGAKPRDASVSGAPERDMCKEFVGDLSQSDDPKLATSLASSVRSLRLPGSMSNQVLTAATLLAVLAIGFAAPSRGVRELEATGGGAASDEEKLDYTYPVVRIGDQKVEVGKTWKTLDGPDQPGSEPPFAFSFKGKMYEIYPTAKTRSILIKEGLLESVSEILSKTPHWKTAGTEKTLVWGEGRSPIFEGVVTENDISVVARWQVFLPPGAFDPEQGEDEGAQGCSDLYNGMNAVAHVLVTGKEP